MAKQVWVVRVVTDAENIHDQLLTGGPLLECLRYAGSVIRHRGDAKGMCFDIVPPRHIPATETMGWAQRNAERMQTFMINAVAAPMWGAGQPHPGDEPTRRPE